MATSQEATFPHYPDGDVLIYLSSTQQYKLHSTTLRASSTFFKAELVESNAAHLSIRAKKEGVLLQYRFDIDLQGPEESLDRLWRDVNRIGKLVLRPLDDRGRLNTSAATDTTPEPALLTHYDNALRSFYHLPLRLSEASGLDSLLHDVRGLVDVAEALGCIPCVSASLDVSLVKHGQTLFNSIAADAGAWAQLGVRIRSEVVVREAVCHLVGQWHSAEVRDRVVWGPGEATAALRALVEAKAAQLDARKKAAEVRLMGFYPDTMMWSAGAGKQPNVATGSRTTRGSGVPTKVGHHTKHIYYWMAVNLFRHWMGQHMCAERTRGASDGGYMFYNSIANAGEGYIDQVARESFTRYFPLSAKARTGFDLAVGHVKEGLKKYVVDLVRTTCSLDVNTHPVEWLTCTEVGRDELPWDAVRTDDTKYASGDEHPVRDKGKGRKEDGLTTTTWNTANGNKSRKRKQPESEEGFEQINLAKSSSKKRRGGFLNTPSAFHELEEMTSTAVALEEQSQSIEGGMHFEIGNDQQTSHAGNADGGAFAGGEMLDDEYGEGIGADEPWEADDEFGE